MRKHERATSDGVQTPRVWHDFTTLTGFSKGYGSQPGADCFQRLPRRFQDAPKAAKMPQRFHMASKSS